MYFRTCLEGTFKGFYLLKPQISCPVIQSSFLILHAVLADFLFTDESLSLKPHEDLK